MADQVTNYQCPACTGPLHFSSETGMLQCEYCGSTYDVKDIEAHYAAKDAEAAAAQAEKERAENAPGAWKVETAGEEWGSEAEGMKAYSCPSCGAELICDETTAATSCPYCGNPTVVPGQFGGTKRPNFVIPFKYNKEAAVAALRQHYKGKPLLPKLFSDENHIKEVKGVYVPFWLFDAKTNAEITFNATNSRSYREGDYDVTETQHYKCYRAGQVNFQRIPVDGSSKMPDDYMDSIEPFDYSELKEFSTAYLPGYMADKYDVDAAAASVRAEKRCHNSTIDCLSDTVTGYQTVRVNQERVDMERGQVKYAMLPVWTLATKWNDKSYLFTMNGQTGKLVGDLPIDKKKQRLWFWGLAAGISAVLSIFLSGPLGGLIWGFM